MVWVKPWRSPKWFVFHENKQETVNQISEKPISDSSPEEYPWQSSVSKELSSQLGDNAPAICYFHFEGPVSVLSRKSPFFVCQNCFISSVYPFMSPFSCMTNLWSISFLGSTSLIKTDSCCLGWVWLQWESNIWVHWLTWNLLFNSSPISCQISIKKEAHCKKGKLYLHYVIRHVLIKTWPTVSLPTCKHYN